MNAIHRRLCRSDYWANLPHSQLLPWALHGVPLDGEVLEIGPGYGVTTRWLAERAGPLTAIEIDPELVAELRAEFAGRVEVRRGDGAALPFAGSDSRLSLRFRFVHIGDTMVVVDPDTLPDRLRLAGLTGTRVELGSRSLRFTATRPLR